MSEQRKRHSTRDEEDNGEDRQPRDHRRSTSHEDRSSGDDSEASSDQLKNSEDIRQNKLYVEVCESDSDRMPQWRGPVLPLLSTRDEFKKKRSKKERIVYREPKSERIDQPSTSGTQPSSKTTKSSESRPSRRRERTSSIDDPISSSADWYKRIGKEPSTKRDANPKTRRVRRRSPSPTREKKDPSKDRSSKSYGSGGARGIERNILPGSQGHIPNAPPEKNVRTGSEYSQDQPLWDPYFQASSSLSQPPPQYPGIPPTLPPSLLFPPDPRGSQGHVPNVPPQENVHTGSEYPLDQSSWSPYLQPSSSLSYLPPWQPEIPPIPPSPLPFAPDPRSYDQSHLRDPTTWAKSFTPSHATKKKFKLTARKQDRHDNRKYEGSRRNRCIACPPRIDIGASQVESSTATLVTAPTTQQAEISSTRSSAEPTPLKPEAPKLEFTSESIKAKIEKPSEDSMVVAGATQTTVSAAMSTITTATQTAASTSVTTTTSNISEPKTSATSSSPTGQLDKSSDDKDCDD